MKLKVKVKLLRENARLPEYKTEEAAACDLCAATDSPIILPAGERALVPTGLSIECEGEGNLAVLLFARSGLASKHGIALANGVGVVDTDYRGEIKVALVNLSGEDYTVSPGDRIAQMMFVPIEKAEFEICSELNDTDRGDGGFGHTGS